jgi:hypothetical protein
LYSTGRFERSFRFFKEDSNLRLDFLSDITAVDYWKRREPRFEVVYQVVPLKGAEASRAVPVPEEDAVDSLTPLWKGANFLEREVWDLLAFALSIIRIYGGSCSTKSFRSSAAQGLSGQSLAAAGSGAPGGGNLRR